MSDFIIFRSGKRDQFGIDVRAVVFCDFDRLRIELSSGREIAMTAEEFDIVVKAKKGQF